MNDPAPPVAPDRRGLYVTLAGVVAALIVVGLVVANLPGSIPSGQTNTDGQSAVAIGSAAITAIATIVGAYLGVRSANVAREEGQKNGEKAQLTIASLAGALPQDSAERAIAKAEEFIQDRQRR